MGFFGESSKERDERLAEHQADGPEDKRNGVYNPPEPGVLNRLVSSEYENNKTNENVAAYNNGYHSTKK